MTKTLSQNSKNQIPKRRSAASHIPTAAKP